MKVSTQLIKEFLINNKLIRGRIGLKIEEIQKIYQQQCQEIQKIRKKIVKYEKNIDSAFNEMKRLRSKLKYCEETIKKAFYPSIENISLIYKKSGRHHYIKARFYWKGSQREVQVGSISNVIKSIQLMIETGYLEVIPLPDVRVMTWTKFIKNNDLVMGAKQIAALKFQEYILRKISSKKEGALDINIENDQNIFRDIDSSNISKLEDDKYLWYEKWRTENL